MYFLSHKAIASLRFMQGNKSLAFFMTALIACKKKYSIPLFLPRQPSFHYCVWKSHSYRLCCDLVMLLDNDTLLPSDMFIPIHWLEQNEKIRALAFTIRAQNLRNADVRLHRAFPLMFVVRCSLHMLVMLVWLPREHAIFWPDCRIWNTKSPIS
jgi:hypothetical protein